MIQSLLSTLLFDYIKQINADWLRSTIKLHQSYDFHSLGEKNLKLQQSDRTFPLCDGCFSQSDQRFLLVCVNLTVVGVRGNHWCTTVAIAWPESGVIPVHAGQERLNLCQNH